MTAEPQFRELPDEVLQRMNLTRELWRTIQTEQAKREARVPNVGDVAPEILPPSARFTRAWFTWSFCH